MELPVTATLPAGIVRVGASAAPFHVLASGKMKKAKALPYAKAEPTASLPGQAGGDY